MKKLFVLVLLILVVFAFTREIASPYDPIPIPPSQQRTGGDPQKGYEYLVTGDYVKGGIPYSVFVMGMGKDKTNLLQREGFNEKLSYEYTAVKALNGEMVVAPNCLQCHAQEYDGKLIMGLGNTLIDFSNNQKVNVRNLERVENFLKLTSPKKYEAAADFIKVGKTIGPLLNTEVRGVNAADRLAAILAAHRDPVTFAWLDEPALKLPSEVIPTDTPPWWLLKKKNAMFYNGFGRGDFGKFLMASNLLTVNDTSESREVDLHMPDVLAYIYSLEAPHYTGPIDTDLSTKGEQLFNKNCTSCHGTYGKQAAYPNLLIPAAVIRTDSLLSTSNYSNTQFVEWFNKSWFTTGDHPARLEPFNGYIAPPLDGIWISAPYLHNGSVPTLSALLNSKARPVYWERNFEKQEYDHLEMGWKYATKEQPGKNTYNTTLPGYSNAGHYFGDRLSAEERSAVIEYLKTL